VIKKY
jgi:hypothetical protein